MADQSQVTAAADERDEVRAIEDLIEARKLIAQVMPLIHGIAEWERENGSASAICGRNECRQIADIVEIWAVTHSARAIDAARATGGNGNG